MSKPTFRPGPQERVQALEAELQAVGHSKRMLERELQEVIALTGQQLDEQRERVLELEDEVGGRRAAPRAGRCRWPGCSTSALRFRGRRPLARVSEHPPRRTPARTRCSRARCARCLSGVADETPGSKGLDALEELHVALRPRRSWLRAVPHEQRGGVT